jgi:selenocysteine lyase/cysteine desulfurase
MAPSMEPSAFRGAFPVFENVAYLNAGTDGPIPRRSVEAAQEWMTNELARGRAGRPHFEGLMELGNRRRELLAGLLGCDADEVALTHSTTDGVNVVLGGLALGEGDEVLTSDEEHPGLLAPLAALQRRGVAVRQAPFAELASAIGPKTRLVAASHVSWVNGRIVDAKGLRESGVPFLLDGAQGIGAVPVDVREMGCDFYAASGQKWLCGPDGTGCLYVRRGRLDDITPGWYGYPTVEDPGDALNSALKAGGARLDLGLLAGHSGAWALASVEFLAEAGWDWVHNRAADLAAQLADMLTERGRDVVPRDRTTLVSWRDEDCEGTSARLGENGVVVRFLPGRGLVRASVGAWNDEQDLERLAGLVTG